MHTGILSNELHIKDGNNFALSLVDIDVSIHADELVQLSGNSILFGPDLFYPCLEEFFGPPRDILIDPMPVIWVVQDHFRLRWVAML